jgi:hypothetical protein
MSCAFTHRIAGSLYPVVMFPCRWRLWIHNSRRRRGKGKCKILPRTGSESPEGEQRYSFTLSLTSALGGGDWLRPRRGPLPPGKRPGTHFAGGWLGPSVGLDKCAESRPQRDSIPVREARNESLYRPSYRDPPPKKRQTFISFMGSVMGMYGSGWRMRVSVSSVLSVVAGWWYCATCTSVRGTGSVREEEVLWEFRRNSKASIPRISRQIDMTSVQVWRTVH